MPFSLFDTQVSQPLRITFPGPKRFVYAINGAQIHLLRVTWLGVSPTFMLKNTLKYLDFTTTEPLFTAELLFRILPRRFYNSAIGFQRMAISDLYSVRLILPKAKLNVSYSSVSPGFFTGWDFLGVRRHLR